MSIEQKKQTLNYYLKKAKVPFKNRPLIIEKALKSEHKDYLSIVAIYKKEAEKLEANLMPREEEEQINFVAWFRQNYPDDVIFMIRNDGGRSPREKNQQLLLGLHAGASDLEIPRWNIYLEMKRQKGGRQSEEQKEFERYIKSIGKHYILANGCKEAIEKFKEAIK